MGSDIPACLFTYHNLGTFFYILKGRNCVYSRSLPELHLKCNASSHHKPFENHQQTEWHKTYFWQVMSLRPNHPVWQRNRAKHHAGANRSYGTSSKPVCCNYCELKTASEINDSAIFKSSDHTDSINSDSFKGTKEFWAKFIKLTFLLCRFLVLQSCCCYYYWAENRFLPDGEEESKENQMLVVNSGKYGCWTIIIIVVVVLFLW